MPIRPLFDWDQTSTEIRLHLYFKSGVKREAVDALLTDTFIKVNSPPYLLHVDLLYEIVPEESSHYFDAEERPTGGGVVLHIHGKKSTAGKVWERLTINAEKATSKPIARVVELASSSSSSTSGEVEERTSGASPTPTSERLSLPAILMSKNDVLARRQQSLQRVEQRYNAMLEKRKEQREAEGRRMTAAQWDVDKTMRRTIEGRMKAEKEAEEEALYAWEAELKENTPLDRAKVALDGGRSEETAKKPGVGPTVQSPADLRSAFLHDPDDHGSHPISAPSSSAAAPVPGVRQQETVRVAIDFTPRTLALPTRARGDEDYYRQSRYKPVNVQDSPMFWKEKGDGLYKNHEFKSAADAYGESIKRDGVFLTCVMNRAACYLHLMEYEKCIQDASLALNILANTPASELSQDRYRYLMCKLHARRGTALVWSEDLQRGRQDYRMAAAYADPETDTQTAKDLAMIEALMRKRHIPFDDEEEEEEGNETDGKKKREASGGGEVAQTTATSSSLGEKEGEATGTTGDSFSPRSRSWRTKMASATAAFYKGQYTEAAHIYGDILAHDPHYSLARSNRVVVRLVQKDFATALKECNGIIEQCQDVVQALQKTHSDEGRAEGEADSDDEEEEEELLEEEEEAGEGSLGETLGMEANEEEAKEVQEARKAQRRANRDVVVMERRAAAKRIKESSSNVYLLLKAYVRGAAAFCGLKDFRSAHQYLQSALRITPYDNDLVEDVLRLEEKIRMDTLISASTGGIPKKEK